MGRYSDGSTALTEETALEALPEGLRVKGALWPWETLRRTDDGGAEIILRQAPDTGERVALDAAEADAARAAAPALFKRRALHPEGPILVASLAAAAAALAAIFLVGVPLAADPIARIVPERYQNHLGQLAWSQIDALSDQCEGEDTGRAWGALGAVFARLKANAPAARNSEIYVVDTSFPNAFTLPDGSIVLTDDLIGMAEGPDEIAGVIAHELGHVQARHVMTNVVRQMGLGLFVDIVFGGAGAGQAVAAINLLSLRYTRADEAEADEIGLRLMDEAGLNPAGAAPLFRRLADEERRVGISVPELLSSHPDALGRAEAAERRARPERAPSLSPADWSALRALCSFGEEPEPGAEPDPPAPFPTPDGKGIGPAPGP